MDGGGRARLSGFGGLWSYWYFGFYYFALA